MIATTGFFDGVHLGHQALLQRTRQLAHETGEESAVITFRPHPREVLFHQHPLLLTSLEEKKRLISAQGIDQIFVLPFTPEFAKLTAEEFFQTYLVNQFHLTTLVIGPDHTLGSDKMGFPQLQTLGRKFGIAVETINDITNKGHRISSTSLRKKALRKQLLHQRTNLPRPQWETRTHHIMQTVISLPLFQQASQIFIYLDNKQEVGTQAIIQKAWELGKKVAVPKIEKGEMHFHYIQNFDDVTLGYKGILEPTHGNPATTDHALLILPAVAVDEEGHRLGQGSGYYDKYLQTHAHFPTIALAFEMQIVDYLPTEPRDKKVGMIITETRKIEITK